MLRMGVVSTAVCAEGTDNPLSMTELVENVNADRSGNAEAMKLGTRPIDPHAISVRQMDTPS